MSVRALLSLSFMDLSSSLVSITDVILLSLFFFIALVLSFSFFAEKMSYELSLYRRGKRKDVLNRCVSLNGFSGVMLTGAFFLYSALKRGTAHSLQVISVVVDSAFVFPHRRRNDARL